MNEHYYSQDPTSKVKERVIPYSIDGVDFNFILVSGVFASRDIDFATKLLIENAVIDDDWSILDLGCGVGVIGISLKKIYPSSKVIMSDVNRRALKYARINAKENKVKVRVKESDLFEKIDEKFDCIISNPPFASGKKICFEIIEQSKNHLNSGGVLQIVAPHRKGGKSLKEKMLDVFGNVEDVAKKAGFRVYLSRHL